jgi:hypothetical protein
MKTPRHLGGKPVLAALLAGSAITFTWHAWQRLERSRLDEQNHRQTVTQSENFLHSAEEDQPARQVLYEKAEKLQRQGMIGDEDRPGWSSRLARQAGLQHITLVDHRFEPSSEAGGIRVTPSRIRLSRLHEEDLLIFLEQLQQESTALVQVRQCRLERQTAESNETASLQAECRIDWITFAKPDGATQ